MTGIERVSHCYCTVINWIMYRGEDMNTRIVIIGGGICAVSAIQAIREVDVGGEICLIEGENVHPYYRIKLSKKIFDEMNGSNMLLQKEEWYEGKRVKLYSKKKVVKIDLNTNIVMLDNGENIAFDKLLLANGASNNVPSIEGINKKGVYSLRTMEDALEIKNYAENEDTNSIVQIGGGILGLELAWNMHLHQKKVFIVEQQTRIMPRQLDEKASKILKKVIEDYGIVVLTNTCVNKIIGENGVTGALTNTNETIHCNMILYSAGIRPNIDIAQDLNIKVNRGIIVNEKMETNIENIYAAGDVAEFDDKVIGLWNVALEQGKVAGYNISGKLSTYKEVVSPTILNAFNISLFSLGCIDENECSDVIVEENDDKVEYKKIFIKDKIIVGAIIINDLKIAPILKSAIEKRIRLDNFYFTEISINALIDGIKNNMT